MSGARRAAHPSGPSGASKPHAARKLDGRVRVEVYLSAAAAARLAALAIVAGSRTAAIERALLGRRPRGKP